MANLGRRAFGLGTMTDGASELSAKAIDQECLVNWRREWAAESLRPLVERHAATVYSRAYRRLGDPEQAAAATRAGFLVMARRRRNAAKLERWLARVALIACRKLKKRSFSWVREWFERRARLREVLPLPEGLVDSILSEIQTMGRKRPKEKLARFVLRKLFWTRWRWRGAFANFLLVVAGVVAWDIDERKGHSGLMSQWIIWSSRFEVWRYSEKVRPWQGSLDARAISTAADLYRTTNVWPVHIDFSRAEWNALYPKRIGSLPHFITSEGNILLRNPEAPRSGLVGVMGYAFDWSQCDLELGGARFENVGVRIKGNVGAMIEPKRPFKIDLDRNARAQKFAGIDELTFNNLMWDPSCLRDALAYEFFRDAGVPAPRTAYAWVSATVEGKWNREPLGLFLLLEPVDEAFALERFGTKKTAVFKPVTYDLFQFLGDDSDAYAPIYDLKTKATDAEKRRIIEFARLVTKANDSEFAARAGEFLDFEEFAGFLAGEVLLASYDSLLTTGQNYFMYVDPRSGKIGFIPWDLDLSWGNFWVGTKPELQRASIMRPWSGENRFLERVLAVEEFRKVYRARLEEMLNRFFIPDRIQKRIDEIAAAIREPISAESMFRLDKFEQEIGAKPVKYTPHETDFGLEQPAYPYKKFVETRARSVRLQLDGKSKGLLIKPLADKM